MSEDYLIRGHETGFDRVLTFTLPLRHARGRVVRLGPVLETILSAHDYPPVIKRLLAECLVITALMGSLLKDEDAQLTVQAQAEGSVVDLLVCDYRKGEVRGYARHDAVQLDALGEDPDLNALLGEGYLAVTFDLATSGERYQGIVPLSGGSLADAFENYFAQSEQVPTCLRVAVRSNGPRCIAGGLLVQHFPDGEEGRERIHAKDDNPDWDHIAIMAGSVQSDELVNPVLNLEQLLWRLFHEEQEVRIEPLGLLERGCRCTVEHYQSILSRFPEDQLAEMRDDDGTIAIDCAFCSKILKVSA